jgi:hypothetical protein
VSEQRRFEWAPPWAPHVQGWYYERPLDTETGMYEEAKVGATCTVCNATFQRTCSSGLMRQWIARFAMAGHLHRDTMDPIPSREP